MQIADDTAHCTINTDVTDGADAPAHTHLSIPLRSMPVHVRQSAHERADPQRQSPYDKPPILGKELHNGIILDEHCRQGFKLLTLSCPDVGLQVTNWPSGDQLVSR